MAGLEAETGKREMAGSEAGARTEPPVAILWNHSRERQQDQMRSVGIERKGNV